MKVINFFFRTGLARYFFMFMLLSSCNKNVNDKVKPSETNATSTETMVVKKQLRHIVLFKFKKEASQEAIAKAEKAFVALPSKISQINSFEWGLNNSQEGIDKGFTHCYFLSFNSEEDRAIYLPHPDHKAFGEILKPILEDVLVVDYWVEE